VGSPFEIRRAVSLPAPPEQVWEAVATGDGLAAWFMPMELDPDSSMVTSWEPGRRLTVRTPPEKDGAFHTFDYRLEPAGPASTMLRFLHHGFTGDAWGEHFEAATGSGWDMYLHTLGQYLTHFPGRPAVYLEAEAPPASAEADAWTLLITALGLSDPPELGAAVHLALPGVGAVEGIVDYASPTFVGLRAPLALIRFHGRALLGMPVAVSQHTYLTTFDVDSASRGWEAWLAGAFG
jgi:hypothetical protein